MPYSKEKFEHILDDLIHGGLERCRKGEIELGATNTRIVTTDMIVLDERVRAKDMYPKHQYYRTNAHCLPNSMAVKDVRELIGKFEYGVFCDIQVPSEYLAASQNKDIPSLLNVYEIVSKVEADAFYDGCVY
jgi:predicted metal-binding protein